MSPSPESRNQVSWKQRLRREFIRYWTNFLYLAIFFGAFTWYRRLVLAEYHISYLNYGTAIIEALVLAKVILIGDALGLGREREGRPLIAPTLRKSLVFTVFVGIFGILEHMIGGLLEGKGLLGGLQELMRISKYELLARCLITFFAFIPFFAFRELRTVLGEGKLFGWFFRGSPTAGSGSAGPEPAGAR
jgi:hypothetical protein